MGNVRKINQESVELSFCQFQNKYFGTKKNSHQIKFLQLQHKDFYVKLPTIESSNTAWVQSCKFYFRNKVYLETNDCNLFPIIFPYFDNKHRTHSTTLRFYATASLKNMIGSRKNMA